MAELPMKNPTCAHVTLSVILLSTFIISTSAVSQELRVVSSDANGVTIEYRPIVRESSIRDDSRQFLKVDVDKGRSLYAADAGMPDLRMRSELLMLRGLEGNLVTVLQADYEDRRDILLEPIPRTEQTEDGIRFVYETGSQYNLAGFFPTATARLEGIGIARDRILGNLEMTPMQYDASRRVLRVYSRLLIRVDFGTPHAHLITTQTKESYSSLPVLNEGTPQHWRIVASRSLRKVSQGELFSGSWYRIEISEEGIYRLDKTWFQAAGIDISSIDPRTIKMYGYGGRELPTDVNQNIIDDLPEVAIEVTGESDGRFDDGDRVFFYGKGPNGFQYDPVLKRYRHYIHRFDKANAYLLTFGGTNGKRMQQRSSLNEPNPYTPQWFIGKEFFEEETYNFLSSGKLWVGKKLVAGTGGNRTDITRKLEGRVSSEPVTYRVQLYSQSDLGTTNAFTLREGTITLDTIKMPVVDFNTDRAEIAASSGVREFSWQGALQDDRSVVSISYDASSPERNRGGYVDWVEWFYARAFRASSDVLAFSSPDTTAPIAYEINGFTNSNVRVFDVTDYLNVSTMFDPSISGGTIRFQAAAENGTPRQYIATGLNAIKTPASPVKLKNSQLRMTNDGAEFVIITADDFVPSANKLKAHREKPGADYISTRVVGLSEIYNEFNGSVVDPTAIRNFIAYALRHWEIKPRYLLLLGDGHFDYRNYTTTERTIVPVWQSENSVNLIATYVTDDYFVQVAGNDQRVDLGVGRLPAQTLEEADDVIQKIITYEADVDFDPWKNRVTFVADDGLTTRGDDGSTHTSQSEAIANQLPVEIEQRKIYIVSYPTENTAQGRRKPDAARDILDQINDGTLIINYTGHGSESVWAHEQVLSVDAAVPQLKNDRRLTFLIAATCAFGLYDKPGLRSGTELFVLKRDGAAIGGISSPRVVFSNDNSLYNRIFIQQVINKGREADGTIKRVGDGNYSTKQELYGDVGFEKFHLFGDPSLRLALPRHRAVVEEILVNDKSVTGDTIQLSALSKVTVKASIRKPDSTVWTEFNGTSEVTLRDALRAVPVVEWNNWTYSLQGGILYRGQATIANGLLTVTFIVPKDISYENNSGRFSMYFDNQAVDGVGVSTQFRIGGSDTTATADDKGPEIQLYMDTRSFRPGDMTNENPLLIADLYDDHGINTAGIGIGHDIEAWLDNSETSIVLNEFYKGKPDSYQSGTVEYRFKNLTPGTHMIRLRAWDIYNNSSTAETYFVVASSEKLTVSNVFNVPNPMAGRTAFTFQHNQADAVSVSIKIYTLAGRLIKTIEEPNIYERFINIPWDGKDEEGSEIANGIYFYKIICTTRDGSRGSEAIGKLSVLK